MSDAISGSKLPSRQRLRCAAGGLVALAAFGITSADAWKMGRKLREAGGRNEVARYMESFAGLDAELPRARVEVQVISDGKRRSVLGEQAEFVEPFLLRFALAPARPVDAALERSWVLLDLGTAADVQRYVRTEGLELVFSNGSGLALLRRGEER